MKLGAVLPTSEIDADPSAVRDYAQAADALGYDHLVLFDHVLGEDPGNRPPGRRGIDFTDKFHEPFVLFGFLAAVTERIKLSTGILILPQRQTALVAKQAAEADVLSGGRLRLGVGAGWNRIEFEALGAEFGNRGRRMEEQVAVMRALWTEELVTFDGDWHSIDNAGLNPMPVQRPIPLWFGGQADVVLRRIGRLGDGWLISSGSLGPENVPSMIEQIHAAARGGRSRSHLNRNRDLGPARRAPAGCLARRGDEMAGGRRRRVRPQHAAVRVPHGRRSHRGAGALQGSLRRDLKESYRGNIDLAGCVCFLTHT